MREFFRMLNLFLSNYNFSSIFKVVNSFSSGIYKNIDLFGVTGKQNPVESFVILYLWVKGKKLDQQLHFCWVAKVSGARRSGRGWGSLYSQILPIGRSNFLYFVMTEKHSPCCCKHLDIFEYLKNVEALPSFNGNKQ